MTLKTLMMTAAASAFIAGGAIAQDTSATGADPNATTGMSADAPAIIPKFTSLSEMTVGDIIGENVYDPNGDTIGDIDYIVGRGDGGANAVIGIGGFLGLGEYTVALPLEDFTYDADQQMVKLDTTKEALKEQPEFDESDAESLPDETRLSDLMASADTSAPATTTEGAAATSDSATGSMTDDNTATDTPAADTATGDAATGNAATGNAATGDTATGDSGAADVNATGDAQTGENKKDDASY